MILPIRVLVLEDHPFVRAVAVKMLTQLGCEAVFQASDGEQALAVLDEVGAVDIALCDLCMEGMDGLEFFRQVGQSGLVGSIIISSSLSADLRRAVRQIVALSGLRLLGDVGKPLHPQALGQLLEKHLISPREERVPQPAPPPVCANEVRHALHDGQFQPYYQPEVDLLSGAVCGTYMTNGVARSRGSLYVWVYPSNSSGSVRLRARGRVGGLEILRHARGS
jgi:CheY-like chemotaxis protein